MAAGCHAAATVQGHPVEARDGHCPLAAGEAVPASLARGRTTAGRFCWLLNKKDIGTHRPSSDDYGWFAACAGQRIVAQVTEGSA